MALFRSALFVLVAGFASVAGAVEVEDDYQSQQWQEQEVSLPAAPRPENLQPFYVSASTENRFLVDTSTLSVGTDGVIRYVLLVQAPEGGRSVSFEGMRCETRERRIYASGRLDGSWSKARRNEWVRIQDATANRQYAVLFLEYFCPFGVAVGNAAEAVGALRQGGHPLVKR